MMLHENISGQQTRKEKARAKINLTLHVGPINENGYHPLHSLVVFADIGDLLDAKLAKKFSLSMEGPFFQDTPDGEQNLILQAANFVAEKNNVNIKLAYALTKNLPIASGIGGGSADAAAALRLLSRFGDIDWSKNSKRFLPVGADVPVCYLSQTCIMEGIGEDIKPLPKRGQLAAILVNPGVGVSTKEVFEQFDREGVSSQPGLLDGSLLRMAKNGCNDLQALAIKMQPKIKTVLAEISQQKGCQLARMSGSGATCFGLFNHLENAQSAAKIISRKQPNWWCVSTLLGELE